MKYLEHGWTRRRALAGLGAGMAAALALPRAALAQLSERPVRLILPVGVGSGVDTITRSASQAFAQALGNPVAVENLPGAGGIVGTSALVKAAPDGFTLGMVSNNHVIFPSVYKSVPFDPIADITPISAIGTTPFLLVANPARIAARDAQALTSLLKARPGDYNYASSGNGTILHLAVEIFLQQSGTKARHIPYKGVGPMLTDLIGGQVDFGVLSLPSIRAQLQSGALVAIGQCGSERNPAIPDIPTLREQGLPDYDVAGWFAAVAPAGLAQDQVRRVYRALSEAFSTPEVEAAMAAQGNAIALMPPEETAAFFRSEMRKYAQAIEGAGLERV